MLWEAEQQVSSLAWSWGPLWEQPGDGRPAAFWAHQGLLLTAFPVVSQWAWNKTRTFSSGSGHIMGADRLPGTIPGVCMHYLLRPWSSFPHMTAGETEAQGGQGTVLGSCRP